MAITAGTCTSYKSEILQGVHSISDTYKVALYTSGATISPATTAYIATGEVSGTGYSAGGVVLDNPTVTLDGTTAILSFNNEIISNCSITARGALIYNSSKSNKAVAVYDFGADKGVVGGGTFVIQMPTADASNGLVRIA